MLYLIPIRWLLAVVVVLTGSGVLALWGSHDVSVGVIEVFRWAALASLVLALAPCAAWRWLPILQRVIFPYLGGEWKGTLKYAGPHGSGSRTVKLDIRHTLYRITISLDTKESSSKTLVLYPERNTGVKRHRLYYVYRNERKEGLAGGGTTYRGLAILGVEEETAEMNGNYFTEQQHEGTLCVKRSRAHPWWLLYK